jgi:pimeloyl-ACP methyl ester carboxylesterase
MSTKNRINKARRLLFVYALLAAIVLGAAAYWFVPSWLIASNLRSRADAAGLESRTLDAGGVRWRYYDGGRGPVLVFVHGVASDRNVWLPLAARLSSRFRIIAPDLPGWGDTPAGAAPDGAIAAQAMQLRAFVTALALDDFVLVGHSMGGAIAGVYAAELAPAPRKLVLLDTYGLAAPDNAFAQAVDAGDYAFAYDDDAGFTRAMTLAFAQPRTVSAPIRRALIAKNAAQHQRIAQTFDRLRQTDERLSLQSRLARLTQPVLALWCRDDPVIDVGALDALRTGLGTREPATTVLDGCRHMPMLERADATAEAVAGFAT